MDGAGTTVTIARKRGLYGMARALILELDGVEIGQLRQNQEQTFRLPPGSQALVGRMDWGQTEPLDVPQVRTGDRIEIRGHFTWNESRQLGVLPLPVSFKHIPTGQGGTLP